MSEPNLGPGGDPLDYPAVSRVPVTVASPPPARWIAPTALVLSVLAVAAAGWSLFKPAPEPKEAAPVFFSGPAADNPKEAACKAADLVASGVMRQSQVNLGPEPAALETVAANTRLAMASGAIYLRENVPVNTPPELAEPITTLAKQLQDAAQHFFIGQTSGDPQQGGRLASAAESTKKIAELCK
jgi:hypothetical protein